MKKPRYSPVPLSIAEDLIAKARAKAEPPAQLPIQQGSKAEEIVVESDLYKVTLSSEGGLVKSWVLKKYRDEKEELLDLVNQPACETLGFPMSMSTLTPASNS